MRRILAPVCAAVLAVGGVGAWALLRTSPPTSHTSNHADPPAVGGANGAATGGVEAGPSSVPDPSPTSAPTGEGQGPIPGPQAGSSNQRNQDNALPADAQPANVLPEVPSVLLIPVIALVVFAIAILRNRRRQRRFGQLHGADDGPATPPPPPDHR